MTTELDKRRQVYVAALERSLDDVVAQLAAMPEVERVVLFGSYATGRRDAVALVQAPLRHQSE